MSQWLLLENYAGGDGYALELRPAGLEPGSNPRPFTCGAEGERFDIVLYCQEDPSDIHSRIVVEGDLQRSSEKSGQLAYSLLYAEGYLRYAASARFQLMEATNISGYSGDLLFALAVVTAALPRKEGYPSLAATGRLDDDGHVQKIQGVASKLKAALAVLPPSSLFFYPRVDDEAIDTELHMEAQQAGVELVAVENLDEAVAKLGIELGASWRGNPYRGLRVFTAEHNRIFFGRHSDVTALERKLLQRESAGNPGILILGSSGRGKSSLVQAGLLPVLEQKLIDRPIFSILWRLVQAENLSADGIASALHNSWSRIPELVSLNNSHNRLESLLSDDTMNRSAQSQTLRVDKPTGIECNGLLATLAEDLFAALPHNRRFVFVIDQMEELFSLAFSDATRHEFSAFLVQLQCLGVWVIATLRSEYFHAYQQSNLLEVFGDGYTLRRLNATALERVIRKPAELRKLRFEVRAEDGHDLALQLRDDAIKEGGNNLLPLLQFILSELYECRDREKGMLTYKAYQKIGGLKGAIGRYANEFLSNCSAKERNVLPEVLVHLIRLSEDGTRAMRQRAKIQLFSRDADQYGLVNKLVEARLLSSDNLTSRNIDGEDYGHDGSVVELAHDYLLTNWESVARVIEDYREIFDQHRKLELAARHWHEANRPKYLLLNSKEDVIKAEMIDAFVEQEGKVDTQTFLTESIRQIRRKYNKVRLVVSIIIIIIAHDMWFEGYVMGGIYTRQIDRIIASVILSLVFVLGLPQYWYGIKSRGYLFTLKYDLIIALSWLLLSVIILFFMAIYVVNDHSHFSLTDYFSVFSGIAIFILIFFCNMRAAVFRYSIFSCPIKYRILFLHDKTVGLLFGKFRKLNRSFLIILDRSVQLIGLGLTIVGISYALSAPRYYKILDKYFDGQDYSFLQYLFVVTDDYIKKNNKPNAIEILDEISRDFSVEMEKVGWMTDEKEANDFLSSFISVCNRRIKVKQYDKAINDCKNAVRIARLWAGRNTITSDDWRNNLAVSLKKTGLVRSASGDIEGALKDQTEAQKQLELALETQPANALYRKNLAVVILRIGDIHYKQGESDKALANYKTASNQLKQLLKESPDNLKYANDLLRAYGAIAFVTKEKNDLSARRETLFATESLLMTFKQSYQKKFWGNSQLEKIRSELAKAISD
jgi:tetratricopeptide (TPR) repeat protein